jgi:hypothetical protein
MLAEICMASLLMLFAYGWTLSFQDIDWDNNLEFYVPVGSIIIALHLVLAAMTYIDFDSYHKYHDFAGVQGILLLILRVLLFSYYIYCIQKNKNTEITIIIIMYPDATPIHGIRPRTNSKRPCWIKRKEQRWGI